MKSFLEFLNESRLEKKNEENFFKFNSLKDQLKDLNNQIHDTTNLAIEQIISNVCELCKMDKEKFIKENPNVAAKLSDIILPSKNASFFPIAVTYYSSTMCNFWQHHEKDSWNVHWSIWPNIQFHQEKFCFFSISSS